MPAIQILFLCLVYMSVCVIQILVFAYSKIGYIWNTDTDPQNPETSENLTICVLFWMVCRLHSVKFLDAIRKLNHLTLVQVSTIEMTDDLSCTSNKRKVLKINIVRRGLSVCRLLH